MSRFGLAVVVAAVGALGVGPFLTHAVLRWVGWRVTLPVLLGYVPARSTLGSPRTACRACGAPISSWPHVAWLRRRGRCPACGEPLAGWFGLVEAATGAAFGVAAWSIGWSLALLPVLGLCTGLVAASAVDLACWRIPTRFVHLTGLVVAVAIGVAAVAGGRGGSLTGAVVGAATYFGLLAALHLASPRLLGFGDVRLGWVIGLVVGWMSWTPEMPVLDPLNGVLRALLAASLAGTVVGVGLLVVRRRSRPYPFGPWLSLGGLLAILLAAPGPV